jgi:hypothetical protein
MGPITLVARREQRTPTLMSRDGNSCICLALSVEYSVLLCVCVYSRLHIASDNQYTALLYNYLREYLFWTELKYMVIDF